ncbi:MAG TPA: L,D-transpeptidase [Afifellaceae bacterium]|nr:L,D-transpeptidase [Afifellaceae bacterium]
MVAFLSAAPAGAQGRGGPFSLFRRSPPTGTRPAVPRDHGPSTRQEVAYAGGEPPGTVIVDTQSKYLYLIGSGGRALRYRVGVGREGFGWTGIVQVGAKSEWPAWRPPAEMRRRDPSLPDYVPPGPFNPMGARAIYLHKGGADTLYRIHGTNERGSIGGEASSGCFRLTNTDVMDLYQRVRIGARVVVY